jgi:hypothetical protein
MASAGKQKTGTSDPTYNLISVAYHALQGAENYERYGKRHPSTTVSLTRVIRLQSGL